MVERLKVKFLAVIWGTRYVQEFARVSMPSYLAPGNLPFVASEADLEVLIMTTLDSRHAIDDEPIFSRLKALCPVRYILIDDLVTTGMYGVTLTLAYARGIEDSGAQQTSTHFIFMNADFVLADGSLSTLVRKLREGHRCIMAPSLRARSEAMVPLLAGAVDQRTGTLAMSPRRMVRLALDNLHPTVIGKTVTQEFVTCATHNQIYWQVDEETLLARYHLIFMLAIKPEVPMGPVNSYCDYGFVPELVPSGQFTILDDSDAFFMLELQPSAQEGMFLRCGTASMTEIAASLSSWTTREHRRFAEIDVVFRSGDLPARLVSARKALAGFVAELRRRMRKTPVDHLDHVYWVSGVQVWTSLKYPDPTEIPVLPPELDVGRRPDRHNILRLILKSLASCYRRPVGHGIPVSEMPSVPIWHHHWLDSKLVLDWLGTMRARTHGRNLLICERGSPLSRTLPRLASFDVGVASDIVAGADEPGETDNAAPDRRYDNVLLHVYRSNVRQTGAILETARARLRPGGTVAVYIEHVNGELDTSNFSSELAQYLDDVLPGDWIGHRLEARFAGGIIKRRIRWCELILLRYVRPASVRMLPHFAIALMLWPVFAALTAVNNFLARNLSSRCPPYCSSALFSLSGIPVPTVANTSRTSNITFNPTARAGIPAALRVEPSPVISDGD